MSRPAGVVGATPYVTNEVMICVAVEPLWRGLEGDRSSHCRAGDRSAEEHDVGGLDYLVHPEKMLERSAGRPFPKIRTSRATRTRRIRQTRRIAQESAHRRASTSTNASPTRFTSSRPTARQASPFAERSRAERRSLAGRHHRAGAGQEPAPLSRRRREHRLAVRRASGRPGRSRSPSRFAWRGFLHRHVRVRHRSTSTWLPGGAEILLEPGEVTGLELKLPTPTTASRGGRARGRAQGGCAHAPCYEVQDWKQLIATSSRR